MLIIARSMRELDFSRLCAVYEESLKKGGADMAPGASEYEQLRVAQEDLYDYLVRFLRTGGYCAIWEQDGSYLSALRGEKYRDGFLISALETRPDSRGKGTATLLLRGVSGVPGVFYSHIECRNSASISVHEKCGFEVYLDHAVFLDGSVDRKSATYRKVNESACTG